MNIPSSLALLLLVGCYTPQQPVYAYVLPRPTQPDVHEASVRRLLLQEMIARQTEQATDAARTPTDARCHALIAAAPVEAFSRGILTPQERTCRGPFTDGDAP
jgi:hypothetical protein